MLLGIVRFFRRLLESELLKLARGASDAVVVAHAHHCEGELVVS